MIVVLRLGHRVGRDSRISTHCGLVARALGADKIVYTGDSDSSLIDSVNKVSDQWGGKFEVEYEKSWKSVINKYRKKNFCIIHLTVYGEIIQDKIQEIRKNKNVLLIVGGEKVPGEIYKLSDYNISVTSQPHSEIASLAVFLDSYFKGTELEKVFSNAKIKVIPQKAGKKIIDNRD